MRIIQIASDGGRSGSSVVAWHLGQGLRAAGHEVIYAVSPQFLQFFGLGQDDATHWPMRRIHGFNPRAWLAFKRRAADADVVLTHDSSSRHFALSAKCLGLAPRLWFMRHCISSTSRFGASQLYRLLVDHQIAISDAVYRSVVESGFPARRASRIYSAVDLSRFQHPDPAEVDRHRQELLDNLPPGIVVIGIVARMTIGKGWQVLDKEGKGYDLLFKALAKVHFPYRVLVFGTMQKEANAALREMAGYYGAQPDSLRFGGFVKDMVNYYPLMTINVLPSRGEGLGLSLIESMAAGVASVGSRVGGITEIIAHGHTGLLFEPEDPDSLAACLERLVASPEMRQDLARCGQKSVWQRFNVPIMVKAFCELLEKQSPREPSSAAQSRESTAAGTARA